MVAKQRVAIILFRDARASRQMALGVTDIEEIPSFLAALAGLINFTINPSFSFLASRVGK
jgi:hypothetical protein